MARIRKPPPKEKPTYEELATWLHYDRETGWLTWRANKGNGGTRGKRAGSCNKGDGYRYIQWLGRSLLAHQICWALGTGKMPDSPLDHINGVKDDNRLCNLRLATVTQNNRNRPKQSNNTSGFKGVTFHKGTGKYQAKIMADGVRRSLGYFPTAQRAHEAYERAAKELHGQFAQP